MVDRVVVLLAWDPRQGVLLFADLLCVLLNPNVLGTEQLSPPRGTRCLPESFPRES